MDSLDLHPEELFDKAARGVASAEDLARIDAHLSSCATCRFERLVRADFDAVGGSTADLDDLVARALSGAGKVESQEVGPPRRRRFGALLVAAVAMMGMASFAAVAQFTGVLPRIFEQRTTPTVAPAPTPTPSQHQRVTPPAPVSVPVVPAPEPIREVAPPPAPVAVVMPRLAPRVAPAAIVQPAPVNEVDATPEIPVVVREPDALELFSGAQRARVQGNTAVAIRDFRVLVARFPDAPAAALAHAELGRLLLDRGEAASALESFDAYLASHDLTLREDVEGARAMALQALGRTDLERAAWEALLREYPLSDYAARARTRLESLAH